VLKEIQKPEEVRVVNSEGDTTLHYLETPQTPKTFENLPSLRKNVEMKIGMTPYEAFYGAKPDVSKLPLMAPTCRLRYTPLEVVFQDINRSY
jgi:hypothetical protein